MIFRLQPFLLILFLIFNSCSPNQEFLIHSPDNNIEVKIDLNNPATQPGQQNQLFFSIKSNDLVIVKEASFGLEFANMKPFQFGINARK